MNGPPEQPNWDRLPHDAEGFFGLDDGFDRRDLKRSYNRLVKQFKPERFPAEFQRIRAAYEELDQMLRYGERRERAEPTLRYEWIVPDPAAEPDPANEKPADAPAESESQPEPVRVPDDRNEEREGERRRRRPRSRPLHERVLDESPESIYEELRRTELKQPFHFYGLAVLSDVVDDTEKSFLDWLLAGLEDFPRDPALFGLLHAHLRTHPPAKGLPKLLEAISRVVTDDRFFSLTEPLWDDLAEAAPFETFRKTLARCERNVRDLRLTRRLVFFVHVLRRVLFKANLDWVEEVHVLIDEHVRDLPPNLEYDLEFLGIVREYLRHRGEFLDGSRLRYEIDHMFQQYCERDEFGGEQAFLAFQTRLVDRIDDLLEAFPVDPDEDLSYLFDVWKWIHFEVRERTTEEEEEFEITEPFVHSVFDMMHGLEAETKRTSLGRLWGWSLWIYMLCLGVGYLGIFVGTIALSVSFFGPSEAALLGVFASVAAAAVGGYLLKKHVIDERWRRFNVSMADACYSKHWRRSIASFLMRTHAPIWVTSSVVDHLVANVEGLDEGKASWLPRYLDGDPALLLYSTALPFVK